jgi:hypothetical protein
VPNAVDLDPAIDVKSTNTELFESTPSTLILPAASLNLSLATEIVPAVTLLSVGVKVAV